MILACLSLWLPLGIVGVIVLIALAIWLIKPDHEHDWETTSLGEYDSLTGPRTMMRTRCVVPGCTRDRSYTVRGFLSEAKKVT